LLFDLIVGAEIKEKSMAVSRKIWVRNLAVLMLTCGVAVASDMAANVTGTWTVTASNGRRKVTQTLVIRQDGAKISGTFKGPRQSGTLDGTLTGNAITFHVTAKTPLDYTGTVDGDTMKGTLSGDGKKGDWTATRSN
jgi:hypothetical protein